MKKKSIISALLAFVMVLTMTTPAFAANTQTVTFNAGTYYNEDLTSNATIKVTNVTKQETKDFSTKLSEGKKTHTYSGKKSKVIYCKASATITIVPNKDFPTAELFGLNLIADNKTVKGVKTKFKYYPFDSLSEEVDTSKKYNEAPECGWVVADGSSLTLTKAGTYVFYVQPFQFYGKDKKDFKLNPVFIVVK